jgi:uncharacterized membrane protein
LAPVDQDAVVAAIAAAEKTTSGEIKVHIEPRAPSADTYARAVEVFDRLGLTQTKLRNAVLIYIASDDRRFAFVGDSGIHAAVGDPFWSEATQTLSKHFRAAEVRQGLVGAIEAIGVRLAAAFPRGDADENELSDEISTGDPKKKGD